MESEARSEGSGDPSAELGDREQPFLVHLAELRQRLLRCVLCVLCVFMVLFWFARDLYTLFATPLLERLPGEATMIATQVASPFLVPIKLAGMLSLFVSIPYLLYQFWAFVAPGLYRGERRLVLPLLISSTLLFYLGCAFAYFIVMPILFAFLNAFVPEGVTIMTDIGQYLSFCMKIFLAFGAAFEVPVATVLAVRTGAVSAETLRNKRPVVIVAAFVAGMLLTPPDIVSQLLLALPMWLLFELGLHLASRRAMPEPVIRPPVSEDPSESRTPRA